MEIKNSHFLITGSNRGIGKAVALMAAQEGAHLYLANRSLKEKTKLEAELMKAGAASVKSFELDLADRKSIEALWKNLKNTEIDLLFNNAGQLTGGLLEDQQPDEIDSMFYVNLNALVHMTRAALPQMIQRGSGKIINHSSVSAVMPFPGASTYAASKAAVRAFTQCLQYELKNTGVSTLTLVTAGIDTRMFNEIPGKFGSFLDVSDLKAMTAEDYALRIRDAILDDIEELIPTGLNLLGYTIASYLPKLYRKGVELRFQRPGTKKA